ncbi:hypothetical protein ANN_18054 [Periplaneta americana]|uniref:Transposase Tc1-like domain-containing protein n=1 Tax=Periplaneta americana TaxID=6978 RepID=A0ABQ8SNN2_PERAM|nr:hypothetical protein ANN_18054 [Periplaneta americana]
MVGSSAVYSQSAVPTHSTSTSQLSTIQPDSAEEGDGEEIIFVRDRAYLLGFRTEPIRVYSQSAVPTHSTSTSQLSTIQPDSAEEGDGEEIIFVRDRAYLLGFRTEPIRDVARAVALYDDGRSVLYIANVMDMAKSTTHDAIKRYRETLEYTRRPGSGRPRATNPNEDRYMVLRVLRERNLPATSVAQQFVNMHGRPISAKTVRRRLKASGLISSRPATGPRLLRRHRVERLRFANDHRDWRNGQWSCVLFTDESRFNLCSPDGRERV